MRLLARAVVGTIFWTLYICAWIMFPPLGYLIHRDRRRRREQTRIRTEIRLAGDRVVAATTAPRNVRVVTQVRPPSGAPAG